ncbi:MAG: hypothetical protein FWF24_01185 [Alphaproteobacteria bacterium]|nr:hypothetical protein [Alphaproteobacteria bacterium]
MTYAPIAVFAYDRVDHFEKMMASLRACHGFAQSPVTIFLDGAKGAQDAPRVEAMRSFARNLGLANVQLVEREKNMGLKASIFDGVSKLCRQHGKVIVLEDDLLVSPCILDYFNAALERYKDETRIWSVIGYQFDVPALRAYDKALILPFTHCWGWATWDRAFSKFSLDVDVPQRDFNSKTFQRFFDVGGVRDYTAMLKLAMQGRINSWFIRWYYTIFCRHGVSVFPPASYVANIGLGAGGTHASGLNPYHLLVRPAPLKEDLVTLPATFCVDYWALDLMRKSWDAKVQKGISFLGRIKRILKALLGK